MERWKEQFDELLEGDRNRKEDEASGNMDFGITTNIGENISRKEILSVLIKLRRGKAPGHDNIRSAQLKYMGEEGEEMLLEMLNIVWEQGHIPEDWEKAVIFPIHKKEITEFARTIEEYHYHVQRLRKGFRQSTTTKDVENTWKKKNKQEVTTNNKERI
ncbi:hypothetical protein CBL_09649 [Carabus blaptoides fortunei]